jgi:hypothetical protein
MKNKSKSVDLRTLWGRAAKIRKVELGSTSVPQPDTVGSTAQPHDPIVESVVPVERIKMPKRGGELGFSKN